MYSPALKDKKILFFSQYFFGYENKIKKKMQEMGASVDLFDEMSVKSAKDRAILKVAPDIFNKKTEKYYFDILKNIKLNDYDYILFIDCEMPTARVLEEYRNVFNKSIFCLHMWDSVKNLRKVERKFRFFDWITTFDREDSLQYGIKLRPLFFSDEYRSKKENKEYKYDISFIGTIHSDRYRIIKEIEKQFQDKKIYIYPYLQSTFIYYFYKAIKPEFRHSKVTDFMYEKMPANDIVKIVSQSKAVLDIQHPSQSGLTMRTLEMIGMKKKIITTNQDISHYDIYNSQNIAIIDRKKVHINSAFFDSDNVELPKEIYEEYSIESWIRGVLNANG